MSTFAECGSADMPIRTFEWGGHGDSGTVTGPSYRHQDNGGWLVFHVGAGWSYLPDYMIRNEPHVCTDGAGDACIICHPTTDHTTGD